MNAKEVMQTLESLGTEQNRKTYARHGAKPPCFGVSFANLDKLSKKVKRDHALAADLWKTGNFDACNLATKIADPSVMTANDLDTWASAITSYCLGEMFARYIASKTAHARQLIEKWSKSKDDLICETAYATLAGVAMNDDELPDEYFEKWLVKIEASIHKAQNRTRAGMNSAVIAIGIRNPRLQQAAVAAAQRIGKVTVDHGDTDCKTPDAVAYIQKAVARKAAPQATRAAGR